jgi:hypothetical protein
MIPNGEAEIPSVASFLPWLVWAWQGLCLGTGSRRMRRCLPLMIAVCVYLASFSSVYALCLGHTSRDVDCLENSNRLEAVDKNLWESTCIVKKNRTGFSVRTHRGHRCVDNTVKHDEQHLGNRGRDCDGTCALIMTQIYLTQDDTASLNSSQT